MRHRNIDVVTRSTRDVASLMVESQYSVGAFSSLGHSMRSHSYSRGADNAVSPLAGRTRVAAKRDVNGFAVPSRQETLLNVDSGNACASPGIPGRRRFPYSSSDLLDNLLSPWER